MTTNSEAKDTNLYTDCWKPKIKVMKDSILSGAIREEPISLPFPAPSSRLHSWAHGPVLGPQSRRRKPCHLPLMPSSCGLWRWPTCSKGLCDYLGPQNNPAESSHLKALNFITSKSSPADVRSHVHRGRDWNEDIFEGPLLGLPHRIRPWAATSLDPGVRRRLWGRGYRHWPAKEGQIPSTEKHFLLLIYRKVSSLHSLPGLKTM